MAAASRNAPNPRHPAPPRHPPFPTRAASVVAIDMARQMLQLYSNSYALVVSTENITQNRWARLHTHTRTHTDTHTHTHTHTHTAHSVKHDYTRSRAHAPSE